jgi:hypothetical protein
MYIPFSLAIGFILKAAANKRFYSMLRKCMDETYCNFIRKYIRDCILRMKSQGIPGRIKESFYPLA